VGYKKTGRVITEDDILDKLIERIIKRAVRKIILVDYSREVPYRLNSLTYIERNGKLLKCITKDKVAA